MIKELCAYIATNSDFVVGTDLIEISADTDVQDECLVIAEPAPGLANGQLTDYRQIPLVCHARAATRFTARDNAYTVFDLLHGKMQISLQIGSGDEYICNFVCRTPYYDGLDESKRRHLFVFPIDVTVSNIL